MNNPYIILFIKIIYNISGLILFFNSIYLFLYFKYFFKKELAGLVLYFFDASSIFLWLLLISDWFVSIFVSISVSPSFRFVFVHTILSNKNLWNSSILFFSSTDILFVNFSQLRWAKNYNFHHQNHHQLFYSHFFYSLIDFYIR